MIDFHIGGEKYREIKKLEYAIERNSSESGEPIGVILGGKIKVLIEQAFDDSKLFNMMVRGRGNTPVDGKLEFFDAQRRLKKTLNYSDAFIIQYREFFDQSSQTTEKNVTGGGSPTVIQRNKPVSIEITLSAKTISMGEGEHENHWTMI